VLAPARSSARRRGSTRTRAFLPAVRSCDTRRSRQAATAPTITAKIARRTIVDAIGRDRRGVRAMSPLIVADNRAVTQVIRVHDVSKRFTLHHNKSLKERLIHLRRHQEVEEFWALRGITFDIAAATTVGLTGPNRSGS